MHLHGRSAPSAANAVGVAGVATIHAKAAYSRRMVALPELLRALKAEVKSLIGKIDAGLPSIDPHDVAQRALGTHAEALALPSGERARVVGELEQFVRELRREHRRMTNHQFRLKHLRDALVATGPEPSPANLLIVGDALQGIEFGNDDDSTDEEDRLELQCEELGRELARQLGASAPACLHRFTLGATGREASGRDEKT